MLFRRSLGLVSSCGIQMWQPGPLPAGRKDHTTRKRWHWSTGRGVERDRERRSSSEDGEGGGVSAFPQVRVCLLPPYELMSRGSSRQPEPSCAAPSSIHSLARTYGCCAVRPSIYTHIHCFYLSCYLHWPPSLDHGFQDVALRPDLPPAPRRQGNDAPFSLARSSAACINVTEMVILGAGLVRRRAALRAGRPPSPRGSSRAGASACASHRPRWREG